MEYNMTDLRKLMVMKSNEKPLMHILFMFAVDDVYGDVDVNELSVEFDTTEGVVECSAMIDGSKIKLSIYSSGDIDFWCRDIPLHFNQCLIYKELFKHNIIPVQ